MLDSNLARAHMMNIQHWDQELLEDGLVSHIPSIIPKYSAAAKKAGTEASKAFKKKSKSSRTVKAKRKVVKKTNEIEEIVTAMPVGQRWHSNQILNGSNNHTNFLTTPITTIAEPLVSTAPSDEPIISAVILL